MFSPAAATFVGALPPVGVVAAKRVPQAETRPSSGIPPAELTQLERMLARVLSCSTGTVVPDGTFAPGTVPVVVLTYWDASVKAAARADASAVPEPMLV